MAGKEKGKGKEKEKEKEKEAEKAPETSVVKKNDIQLNLEKLAASQPEALEQLAAALQAFKEQGKPEKPKDLKKEDHQFWKSQPVVDYNENPSDENGPIEPDKTPDEIRQTPLNLPDGYEWCEVDIEKEAELVELYTLLSQNYVEDEDAMFRFDYSPEFLKWALQPPGWRKLWFAGVRVASNKKLVAFISAVPAHIRIYNHQQLMVEVNFLCVHKKLRAKRLAPVLIKEITRRVHVTGTFQAAYTAGLKLPGQIASCRYYHRSLNPKKLIETGFSHLGKNMTMARTIKLYKLPDKPETIGFRDMVEEDIPQVFSLLSQYLEQFSYAPIFSEEEFRHYFATRDKVVYSYVVEDPNTHQITDFVSFYSLPSTVIKHEVHKVLNVAYCYYYAAVKTPLENLMSDCLVQAKNKEFDVFNCLEVMKNESFLKELKFGAGDGFLQYYLYNWKCKPLTKDQVGLVLL